MVTRRLARRDAGRMLALLLVAPITAAGGGSLLLGGQAEVHAASRASGKQIVKEALKHKGERYVWGEESPKKGFDCSGLTWYVFQKVANIDIGRTVQAQWDRGSKVSKDKLKAGDLVFFKNTYEKGLSHVGIFIGGGKFIHAQNEETGVVITPLDSDYYTDHWAGARRI